MTSPMPSQWNRALMLGRASVRAGTAAGLAMIPFAAVFRARGLRVNEYGRKTLSGSGPESNGRGAEQRTGVARQVAVKRRPGTARAGQAGTVPRQRGTAPQDAHS